MCAKEKVAAPPLPLSEAYHALRQRELDDLARVSELSRHAKLDITREALLALPLKIDYGPQIPFVRHQGAWGCGMYSAAACWDIMNELVCPHSPNLSVNRHLWAHNIELRKELIPAVNLAYKTLDEYMLNFGCPTEGTELTDSDAVRWPFPAGDKECPNFRLKETHLIDYPYHAVMAPVKVEVDNLRYHLSKHPLRLTVMNKKHFVALIGFDDGDKKFKIINSWGDQWYDPIYEAKDGYGYIPYDQLNQLVQGAEYFEIVPPKPTPVVRISVRSNGRQGIYLWLGVTGTTKIKRIWPNGQRQDNSKNLTFTVTLPDGFAWPPKKDNSIFLMLFDSGVNKGDPGVLKKGPLEMIEIGAPAAVGGKVLEFSAAYGAQAKGCKKLHGTTVDFLPHKLLTLTIP